MRFLTAYIFNKFHQNLFYGFTCLPHPLSELNSLPLSQLTCLSLMYILTLTICKICSSVKELCKFKENSWVEGPII